MHEGFEISGNPPTSEQYDVLVDKYPWAYYPNKKHHMKLKIASEAKEKRELLDAVNPKSTLKAALSSKKKKKPKTTKSKKAYHIRIPTIQLQSVADVLVPN